MQKKWADFPEFLCPAQADRTKKIDCDEMSLGGAPVAEK
jgi:hypothetical protein